MNFLIGLGTVILVLLCGIIVLLVLMQRASANSGMGAALGGGAAESALGGAAGNTLTKGTIWGMGAFFLIAFLLFLGQMALHSDVLQEEAAGLGDIDEELTAEAEAEAAAQAEQETNLTDISPEVLQMLQEQGVDVQEMPLPFELPEETEPAEAPSELPATEATETQGETPAEAVLETLPAEDEATPETPAE